MNEPVRDRTTGARVVVVVGADLMARARLDAAVAHAGGEVAAISSAPRDEDLQSAVAVVIDLDRMGPAAADVARAVSGRSIPVVGFFSHVDEALRASAVAAGIEALPRGRFWRELPVLAEAWVGAKA